jgi:hypothetical protein
VDRPPTRLQSWQARLRDPSLSVLLVMLGCMVFVAAPLSAMGSTWARYGGEALVLVFVLLVVLLSHNRASIVAILVGLTATGLSFFVGATFHAATAEVLGRGGVILTFLALSYVVARAVFAPGPITSHRLQGAIVLYLNIGVMFGSAYRLLWELKPAAFNLPPPTGLPGEIATMLYFSFATLTTTGYGDIMPLDPFARGLANLEAVVGQLYLATTLARLVTLELESRRR